MLLLIDEANKETMHGKGGKNVIYYSRLNQWSAPDAFRNFSVKVVLQGMIRYTVGATPYFIREGQVLIGHPQPGVKAFFDSRETVSSLCLNIDADTMAEACQVLSGGSDLDNLEAGHYERLAFTERVYHLEHDDFLAPLRTLAAHPAARIDEEFFLDMGERVLLQLFHNCRIYDRLPFTKTATKREILRRLDIARDYVRGNFLGRPTVKELARMCHLSEFHFFRAFRQAYRESPYQFQLRLRLEEAQRMLRETDFSLTDISGRCAFPDLPTFSKAYKRMYQQSPSANRTRD
jgi:AraC family transcriptional regulator